MNESTGKRKRSGRAKSRRHSFYDTCLENGMCHEEDSGRGLRSERALIDVAYSEGVIPEIFLNCLEK